MKTERADGSILIRPYRRSDVGQLLEASIESVKEVYPFLPWCHPGYRIEEAEGWISFCEDAWANDHEYNFAVVDGVTGKFFGGCGINMIRREHGVVNLGYWVRSSCAGRGVTTAAARMTTRFALEDLRMGRVEILASVKNRGSQRVAEKIGAMREGILRNRLLLHGNYHDAVIYSIVPGDPL